MWLLFGNRLALSRELIISFRLDRMVWMVLGEIG